MYQYVDIISQFGFSIPIKVSITFVDEYIHWLKYSPGNPIHVINITVLTGRLLNVVILVCPFITKSIAVRIDYLFY